MTDQQLPRNIPPVPVEIVGRKPELAQVLKLLTSRRAKAILLVGPPGSGKTTLAKMVANQIPETAFEACLWIDGASLLRPGEFGREILRQLALDGLPDDVDASFSRARRALMERIVCIIIDGLDEAHPEVRPFIDTVIHDIVSGPSDSSVLITTREHDFQRLLGPKLHDRFNVLQLAPLTRADVHQYLEQRMRSTGKASVNEELLSRIMGTTGGNPLLLSLVTNRTSGDESLADLPSDIGTFLALSIERLAARQKAILQVLAQCGSPLTPGSLAALLREKDAPRLVSDLDALRGQGLIRFEGEAVLVTHQLVREFVRRELGADEVARPGTLYLTIDPSVIVKEDIVELLETLNAVYQDLGGDELIIREDSVGRFVNSGVLV